MPPKTERLELRLDGETINRVDTWCGEQDDGPSRSEGVRRLIEIGLEARTKEGFHLSRKERLDTWMLSEILKNQIDPPTDAFAKKSALKEIDLIQQAIYGGHFWALNWELTGVMHDHTADPKVVRVVVNILDMWTFIERAFAAFTEVDRARLKAEVQHPGKNPRFVGFDGNNEGDYMNVASFLVDQLNRFQDFKGRDFNSHFPTVNRYKKMVTAFEPMRVSLIGRELNVDEVIRLLSLEP